MLKLTDEEKQLIWDALFYYRFYCYHAARSGQVGYERYSTKDYEVTELQRRLFDEWKDEIH